jgi:Family of unknown function (DUF5898)
VLKATGHSCLVMPYFHPIPQEKWVHLLENGSIQEALQNIASCGFLHDDVKWCHLGLWKDRVVLCDLGSVREEYDKKKREVWCNKVLEKLQQMAPPQPDEKPSTKRSKRACGVVGNKEDS